MRVRPWRDMCWRCHAILGTIVVGGSGLIYVFEGGWHVVAVDCVFIPLTIINLLIDRYT